MGEVKRIGEEPQAFPHARRPPGTVDHVMLAGVLLAGILGMVVAILGVWGAILLCVVLAVLLIAVVVGGTRLPFAYVFSVLMFPVALNAERAFSVWPWMTVSGAATAALSVFGTAMLLSIRPAHAAWRIVTPVIVLVAVGLIWQAAGGLTAEGMQSIAVLVLLAVTILITSGVALCQPSRSLRIVDLGLSLSGLATALRFVTQELIAPSMSLLGPRGVASFLSICVAWSAGRWVGGSRGHAYLSLLMLGAIANSLSRTAIGVSVFVLAAACLLRGRRQRVKASREAGRLVLAGMLAIGILLVLVRVADPLGERWTTGDVVSVGPVRINVMGRGVLWDATWRSAMTSPLIGHGPGSARQLIRAVVPDLDHPHNDYLRLLHDYGFLGWTVWMAFLLRSFALAVPDRNSRFERGPAVGLLLALIAFSVLMVTDNVLVYPFVVGPLGAIVGLLAGYLRASAGARSIAVGSIRRGL